MLERELSHRRKTTTGEGILDMSEWMSRVALEMVGQTILGYSFDPLDSPYNNPYTSAVKELMCVTPKIPPHFCIYSRNSFQSHHLLFIPCTTVCSVSIQARTSFLPAKAGGMYAEPCCAEGKEYVGRNAQYRIKHPPTKTVINGQGG